MINSARSIAVIRHAQQKLSMRARPISVCVIAAFATFCMFFSSLSATAGDPFRYRGELRNSPGERKLNAKQLDVVLTSLRDKSGLLEMRFDENGFLTLGDRTKFSGGSAVARELLNAAALTAHAVDLESHMYSSKVAFGRLAEPIAYQHYSSGAKIDAFPLEMDFSDFSKLRGDRQALAAFDLGFVILHELGHAALGLRDAVGDPQGLGECEALINRIRRELNLPERQTYVAQTYTAPTPTHVSTKFAELAFARAIEKQGRMRIEKFNLRWEASIVGPITEAENRGSKIKDRMKVTHKKSIATFLPAPE
ncbi:MAG: hypothetical protein ACREA2_05805 [Blastocatellia bacterium]